MAAPCFANYTLESILEYNNSPMTDCTLVVFNGKAYDVTTWHGRDADNEAHIRTLARDDPRAAGIVWSTEVDENEWIDWRVGDFCIKDEGSDEEKAASPDNNWRRPSLPLPHRGGDREDSLRSISSPDIFASPSTPAASSSTGSIPVGTTSSSASHARHFSPTTNGLSAPGPDLGSANAGPPGPLPGHASARGVSHLVLSSNYLKHCHTRLAAARLAVSVARAELAKCEADVAEAEAVRDWLHWQACEGVRPRWRPWEMGRQGQ